MTKARVRALFVWAAAPLKLAAEQIDRRVITHA